MKINRLIFEKVRNTKCVAKTPFGNYSIEGNPVRWIVKLNKKLFPLEGEYDNKFYSLDKAINAAQEDFERRVNECIENE